MVGKDGVGHTICDSRCEEDENSVRLFHNEDKIVM
jgi:hypothetical protein